MAQQSIVKVPVKFITNFLTFHTNFFSFFLGFNTAVEPCPTEEINKNNLLIKKIVNEVLEYHCTHRPKNTTKVYTLK